MELPRSGTGSGVILGTILSTASFMIVAIVLPAVHINMQRKMTIMLSEVGECRVSFAADISKLLSLSFNVAKYP